MSSYKISMKRNSALLFAAAIFVSLFSWALAAPGVYAASAGFTTAEVSTHNTSADCWLYIDSKVYNVTGLISSHSGGASVISSQCGKNATAVFNSFPHPQSVMTILMSLYYVGDLAAPDTLPPVVAIISPASVTYPSSSVALSYTVVDSGSGVNTSACSYSLDAGAAVPLSGCANSTLSGLLNGVHTVNVSSKDNAGNSGSASRSFTVDVPAPDVTSPVVTIVSPVTLTYASSSVALKYTVVDTGSGVNSSACTYSLDGGAAVPLAGCANSTLSGLADGLHSVEVYAMDIAGNAGNASRYFTVNTTVQPPAPDTLPPVVTIVSPANATYATSALWLRYTAVDTGSGVNASACSYSLDGGAAVSLPACANSSLSVPAGAHTLAVFSEDNAGNAGNASRSFTVDLSQPPSSPPNSTHHGKSHPPKNGSSHGHDDDNEGNDENDHATAVNYSLGGNEDNEDDHAAPVNASLRGHEDDNDDYHALYVNYSLHGHGKQEASSAPRAAVWQIPFALNGTEGFAPVRSAPSWVAQFLDGHFSFLRLRFGSSDD